MICWPAERVDELVERLAEVAGFQPLRPPSLPPHPHIAKHLQAAAQARGLRAEAVTVNYSDVETFLFTAAPAMVCLSDGTGVFGIIGRRGKKLLLLGLDLKPHPVPAQTLIALLRAELDAPLVQRLDQILKNTGIHGSSAEKARQFFLNQRLSLQHFRFKEADPSEPSGTQMFLLRPAAERGRIVFKESHLYRSVFSYTLALILTQALHLGGWWVAAQALLVGGDTWGWLSGWALIVITELPLQGCLLWLQGRISIEAGQLLKQRLLLGALKMEPETLRQAGVGQLIARSHESQAIESLTLSAGFSVALALIELLSAAWLLGQGVGSGLSLLILGAGLLICLLLLWKYTQLRQNWTQERMVLTSDILANMVGYRTRIAQLPPERWHQEEDQALDRYLRASQGMDRHWVWLNSIFPGIWRIFALIGILLSWNSDQPIMALALGLGGVLMAYSALLKLLGGASAAIGAAVAAQAVLPLIKAGGKSEPPPTILGAKNGVLEAQGLTFAHPHRPAILQGIDLRIAPGDRILLEGASGAGKSTLGALLTGLRTPDTGLLLLGGLDLPSLGTTAWRKRVVLTPQFHENHILNETLAFNLLMGRCWPAEAADLDEAHDLCMALGLQDLLARMPSGMMQIVGESGWQLSHGEQSRIMLARALLQGADVIVLDESFAALDPETLSVCLKTVFARAPALLVIAHP